MVLIEVLLVLILLNDVGAAARKVRLQQLAELGGRGGAGRNASDLLPCRSLG
jgi:hypothetical protein